jgi:hypothetical protein
MMVVADPRFIASDQAGRLDPPDETRRGEGMKHVIHGLPGHIGQGATHGTENRLGVGVRMRMHRLQHRDPWTGYPKTGHTQPLRVVRHRGHRNNICTFLDSVNSSGRPSVGRPLGRVERPVEGAGSLPQAPGIVATFARLKRLADVLLVAHEGYSPVGPSEGESLMRSEVRTAIALFGGATVLVLAVGCGGGSKGGPTSTTTITTTTTTTTTSSSSVTSPPGTTTAVPGGPTGGGGPGGGGGSIPGGPTGWGGPGGGGGSIPGGPTGGGGPGGGGGSIPGGPTGWGGPGGGGGCIPGVGCGGWP